MRWMHSLQIGLVTLMLLALPGCGAKLNYSKTVKVVLGETHRIMFDEPLVNKATVTIKSPGVPVNAYLVLLSTEDAAMKDLDSNRTPTDVLASAEKTEDKTFEIAPGKKPFALLLYAKSKKAEVIVTVIGQ